MNKKILKEIDAAIKYVWKYDIAKDYDKIHHYICERDLECPKYYMATIWEERPDSKQWLDNQAWAKGFVTELNADYGSRGDMLFYVKEH